MENYKTLCIKDLQSLNVKQIKCEIDFGTWIIFISAAHLLYDYRNKDRPMLFLMSSYLKENE